MGENQTAQGPAAENRTGPGAGMWVRNAPIVVLALAALTMSVVFALVDHRHSATEQARVEQLRTLERKVIETEKTRSRARAEGLREGLGVDPARLVSDGETIAEVVRLATTWDSGETYASNRDILVRRYKLNETGQFLSGFMPAASFIESPDSTAPSGAGERRYYIDEVGVNSALGAHEVSLVSALGATYRYAVPVQLNVGSDTLKTARAQRTALIELSIDGAGAIIDISGYAAAGSTRIAAR